MQASYYKGNRTFQSGPGEQTVPSSGQVQVAVAFCGICGTDLHIYHGEMDQRVCIPQIIGHEMSGTVKEIGEGVSGIAVGDRVVVRPLQPCGSCPACQRGHSHICQKLKFLGIDAPGALQSYWTVPAETLHHLPAHLSLAHGALIEPLAVACHDVRRGKVLPGEYVLVIGGGPIGTLIGLVAKLAGARVLISEVNPFRLRLAQELGLETVNPLEIDLVNYVETATGSAGADVVFEVSGTTAGAESMIQVARTRGRIVVVAIFSNPPAVNLHRMFWRELEMLGTRLYESEDFEQAISLAASGNLPLDRLITTIRPLDQIEDSFRELESGGEVMKILLQVGKDPQE